MPTFVINDETKINSYGFRTRNSGIDLERFNLNPVMLDEHYNSNWAVVGKWLNIRIEGTKLLADTEFDSLDEAAKRLEGKVDRGYIKACSMGITYDREKMVLAPDGKYELTESELYEVSIVAIPSNANAIRLYASTGVLIPENEVRLSIAQLAQITNHTDIQMEKITLSPGSLVALGLTATPETPEAINLAIASLADKLTKVTGEKNALQEKFDLHAKTQATTLVDEAIVKGQLTADLKEQFVTMATGDYALAAKIIGAMPVKTSLKDAVVLTHDVSTVKTGDDFMALPLAAQLAFKNEHPEAYKALWA